MRLRKRKFLIKFLPDPQVETINSINRSLLCSPLLRAGLDSVEIKRWIWIFENMSPVVLLNTFINHVFLSAVEQSNNIADIMGEGKGEDEKEGESEEVRIKSYSRSYSQGWTPPVPSCTNQESNWFHPCWVTSKQNDSPYCAICAPPREKKLSPSIPVPNIQGVFLLALP